MNGVISEEAISTQQQFRTKYDAKFSCNDHLNEEPSQSIVTGNWSLPNVNAKQAWKNGAEKLSQTLNNVRTTFGVLSQRIKKSTKKRQPLINVESPGSPVTPYARSKALLGRTPTKLYSPFSIDTPTGKENKSNRFFREENHSGDLGMTDGKKRLRRTRLNLNEKSNISKETVLSNDLLQTQIGIYEFQSVANKIVQNGFNN